MSTIKGNVPVKSKVHSNGKKWLSIIITTAAVATKLIAYCVYSVTALRVLHVINVLISKINKRQLLLLNSLYRAEIRDKEHSLNFPKLHDS